MIKKTVFALTLVAALVVPTQSQAQVTGTYTVSGSSLSWFLNFTFTNGVAGSWAFSFDANFTSMVDSNLLLTYAGAPGGYIHNNCPDDYFWGIAECSPTGAEAYGIATGDSLSGFLATSTVGTIPDSIAFMAYTWNEFVPDAGPVVTYATRVNASVPEPGSMMLLATGMLGLVGIRRRRRSQN